jgi:hypothetical protein
LSEPPIVSLYNGDQQCIGFLVNRGKLGWEGFDANECPLGLFKSRDEAAAAVFERAPS